jgi:hypothetical protein
VRPLLALVLACGALSACTQKPAEIEPAPAVLAPAGLGAPLYRSGTRLKLRWAEAQEDASVRLPIGIVDAALGRDCELKGGPGDPACRPVADLDAGSEDVAYLDADEREPALLVDDEVCRGDAETDRRLWTIPPGHGHASEDRFLAGAPRRVKRLWVAVGAGCTPGYEERRGSWCVRPMRAADRRAAARTKEMRFGRAGDPSGLVAAVGLDGSVLPLALGPEYLDGARDFRCAVEEDACVPRWADSLQTTPTLGAELPVTSYSALGPNKWARRYGEEVWAALSPAPNDQRNAHTRTVLAVLTRAEALRFAPFTEGRGRLVLRGKILPDGRRVPLALHDTQLGRDCVPTRIDGALWRCTVQMPRSCRRAEVGEREVLTGSSSFCNEPATCCHGGPIWFPREPARAPRRFDIGPDLSYHPAVPGRAARFAEAPRVTDHVGGWQPQVRKPVWDKTEELGAEVFAELRVVEER